MSLVPSREVAGPDASPVVGGQQLRLDGVGLRNGKQLRADDVLGDIFALVDANANELGTDCNCDLQRTNLFEERHWGYAEENGT